VRQVRENDYQLVIDLHSLRETNLLGYLSGAPLRLFARRGGRSLDLLGTIPSPASDREKHLVDAYLDVLAPLGIAGALRVPQLPTRREDDETIERLLETHGVTAASRLVGFFPGAGNPSRQWPLERFAEVAERLARDGMEIVLLLGPEERALREKARALFPDETIVVEPASLSLLASAAARLEVLVSNDTGPMHVAAAVGTPVVLVCLKLHRLNRAFLPVGDDNKVIDRSKLTDIKVAEVYDAARSILANRQRSGSNSPHSEALRK
jgi:ADP-heptose:LPS heptosyltransferase